MNKVITGTLEEIKHYTTSKAYNALLNDHHPDNYIYTVEVFSDNKCVIY